MAFAGITLKVMPESTDVDMDELEREVKEKILKVYGEVGEIRVEEEPIAFGLRALKLTFVIDEKLGADPIEQAVAEIEGVASARVVDFRRAIG
jgi:elongation factor 1-beta